VTINYTTSFINSGVDLGVVPGELPPLNNAKGD